MMTQISQQAAPAPAPAPTSPRQAGRRRSPLDRRLDTGLFKALADPTRARLLACLVKCRRPCSVSEVAECCSVDFSVVARHLSLLARAGVLDAEKKGRTVWYAPRTDDLCARLRALADALQECCPCAGGIALPGDDIGRKPEAGTAACCIAPADPTTESTSSDPNTTDSTRGD